MNNRVKGRKGGLKISRVSPGYDPNSMGNNRNAIFPDEGGTRLLILVLILFIATSYHSLIHLTSTSQVLFLCAAAMEYSDFCIKISWGVNMAEFQARMETDLKIPTQLPSRRSTTVRNIKSICKISVI